MVNSEELLQLCRLCLVKEQVNIPIFNQNNDQDKFVKILTCLPVKVAREDSLPQKICSNCSYKLDAYYQFWNISSNSEKQLLEWLHDIKLNKKTCEYTKIHESEPSPFNVLVKKEPIEPEYQCTHEKTKCTTETQEYIFQPEVIHENVFLKQEIEPFENDSVSEESQDHEFQPHSFQVAPKFTYKSPKGKIFNIKVEEISDSEDDDMNFDEESNKFPDASFNTPDDLEIINVKPQILNNEEEIANTSLLEKSQQKYELTYQKFMDWRKENKLDSFSESVLITYMHQQSCISKPSTLWCRYSMLRSTLYTHHNINISKYQKLKAFLKRKSSNYKPKKSGSFTTDQINKFLEEAPDKKYLLMKVVLVIGIAGACKKTELRNILPEHIEDTGNRLIINIPAKKSHMCKCSGRTFVISEKFYSICKKYMDLRPTGDHCKNLPFFVNYLEGKCTKQPVGINKIGNMSKEIAQFLQLPNAQSYTGRCYRRSSTTIPTNARNSMIIEKHIE